MLRNWRVKGILQKILSVVPAGDALNDRLQRSFGELKNFDAVIRNKALDDWLNMVALMEKHGISAVGMDLLEIGTGWFPTLPVCFSLLGAKSCHTFDLHRHLSSEMTFAMVERLGVHLPEFARQTGSDLAGMQADHSALLRCGSLEELLQKARIHYAAPADATRTNLPENSIDLIFSNSVLEHVPGAAIQSMMRESYRILRPVGYIVHGINFGDHYAYFDRSITEINYLKFSDRQWSLWNNDLLYQNRLRPCDFKRMTEECGYRILLNRHGPRAELQAPFDSMTIAQEFKKYPREELTTTSVDLIAQKPVG